MANKSFRDLTRLLPAEMLSSDLIAVESSLGGAIETKRLELGDLFNAAALTSDVSFADGTLFADATTHQVSINGAPSANTSDKFTIHGDTYVSGSIYATGMIISGGDVEIGDDETDTITFNAEISSDIIPDINNTYYIGNDSNAWKGVTATNLIAKTSLDVQGTANVDGNLVVGTDFLVNTTDHFSRISSLRVGATSVDPGNSNVYIEGVVSIAGNVYIDTNTLYVDSTNNRVGIGCVPTTSFDVSGGAKVSGEFQVDDVATFTSNVVISGILNLNNAPILGVSTITGESFISTDYSKLESLRIGTTSTDPGTGNAYVENNVTIGKNLSVNGNLYVTGSTVTINSTEVAITDASFTLRKDAVTGGNGGIVVTAGGGTGIDKVMQWHFINSRWELDDDVYSSSKFITATGDSSEWETSSDAVALLQAPITGLPGGYTPDPQISILVATPDGDYRRAVIDNGINTGVQVTWHEGDTLDGYLEFDASPELQVMSDIGMGDNWILYDTDYQSNEGIAVSQYNTVAICPTGHGKTYGVGTSASGLTHVTGKAITIWGDVFVSGSITSGSTASRVSQEYTATANQTLFTLSSASYTIGAGQLDVYVDGILQYPSSYTETSTTSITMSEGIQEDSKVMIVVRP